MYLYFTLRNISFILFIFELTLFQSFTCPLRAFLVKHFWFQLCLKDAHKHSQTFLSLPKELLKSV